MGKKPIVISEKIEELKREATQDALTAKYNTEMGQKAIVQREVIEHSELKDQLRLVLQDIGMDIQKLSDKIPKGMNYVGSMAVHVYKAPTLGMIACYSQLNISNCSEQDVSNMLRDLRGSAIESFGHKRQKLRSGL